MPLNGPTVPNKTGIAVAQDVVMTPPATAQMIIDHFKPTGSILEPCYGSGSFYDAFPEDCTKDWCEIAMGRDFYDYDQKVDWIITNPPFSIFDNFLLKSFDLADNIVMFVPLNKTFKSAKMELATSDYGGIKEIVNMGTGSQHDFSFGFPIGCIYYQRGYTDGNIKYTRLYNERGHKRVEQLRKKPITWVPQQEKGFGDYA